MITIDDGIINPDFYSKEKIRLLWVLKEANDTTSTEGWDMKKFLRCRRVEDKGLFNYSKWKMTFGLICKISHGVLDSLTTYEKINSLDDEELASVLDKIAYINVKKTAGGAVVDYEEFNKYLSNPDNLAFVRNQIRDIKPHVIICGNTFHYLFPNLKAEGFDYNKDWLHKDGDIKYINGWHPNAKTNHEEYFNSVRENLSKK
jgi:hypothetical protein